MFVEKPMVPIDIPLPNTHNLNPKYSEKKNVTLNSNEFDILHEFIINDNEIMSDLEFIAILPNGNTDSQSVNISEIST